MSFKYVVDKWGSVVEVQSLPDPEPVPVRGPQRATGKQKTKTNRSKTAKKPAAWTPLVSQPDLRSRSQTRPQPSGSGEDAPQPVLPRAPRQSTHKMQSLRRASPGGS